MENEITSGDAVANAAPMVSPEGVVDNRPLDQQFAEARRAQDQATTVYLIRGIEWRSLVIIAGHARMGYGHGGDPLEGERLAMAINNELVAEHALQIAVARLALVELSMHTD